MEIRVNIRKDEIYPCPFVKGSQDRRVYYVLPYQIHTYYLTSMFLKLFKGRKHKNLGNKEDKILDDSPDN